MSGMVPEFQTSAPRKQLKSGSTPNQSVIVNKGRLHSKRGSPVVDGEGVEAQSQLAAGTEGMEDRRQPRDSHRMEPPQRGLLCSSSQPSSIHVCSRAHT